MPKQLILDFEDISLADVPLVGGKNASLGELFGKFSAQGVGVADGFATTSAAYRQFLSKDNLEVRLRELLKKVDVQDLTGLAAIGQKAREMVLATELPTILVEQLELAYDRLELRLDRSCAMAVRSSATAEDLPGASFAGQHSTFLNVTGKKALLEAVHGCYASLFTDRAIDYRIRNGFDHMQVSLSVGVQPMIRSDIGASGVIFTLDPESGFRDAVVISGSYGLGEFVVQGTVNPDEWTVFKPTLERDRQAIIGRRLGSKKVKLVLGSVKHGTRSMAVQPKDRRLFCLSDAEVTRLAKWACLIEQHYSQRAGKPQPMDIEWSKDGYTGELYILQARPETVHSANKAGLTTVYKLTGKPEEALVSGQAVGERIASGPACIVKGIGDFGHCLPGAVLFAPSTDPDWEPMMKKCSAIVTDQGGRTAHAAIVSREIGIPCIVGTGDGTRKLVDGEIVTVSCAEGTEGRVYRGAVEFSTEVLDTSEIPNTRTEIMVNVGDPSKAFSVAVGVPNSGVGLARTEFIVTDSIGIHPMALARYPNIKQSPATQTIKRRLNGEDPTEFFVSRFSEGVARIAAAFWPKPVIVRTSDFKTNEYRKLLGGAEFEPHEENPMIGFRGASRYYDPKYADGFALECKALRRVRTEMGLTNVVVMIPFCRTVAEAERVVEVMASHGLRQGEDGLEIYGMCEIPSNVVNAEAFLGVFDGYSIGSNDLTQLTLGLDRDSGTVAHLFDERDPAVKSLIAQVIHAARRLDKHIGICGQAPSDYPDFARWLVEQGISSISLNPDSVIKTIMVVAEAEANQKFEPATAKA